ncbi:CLUMA_CG017002, isoform A [Clunio marinus]|uniref:CLUMA_CG017002, isoform A n=1 Tax=Clunio marinus TaxID=568069 RepID=A0A1J1IUI1_9DIPT|nr:CLUMA_CG017002, isoform A [Clunio marinus]
MVSHSRVRNKTRDGMGWEIKTSSETPANISLGYFHFTQLESIQFDLIANEFKCLLVRRTLKLKLCQRYFKLQI